MAFPINKVLAVRVGPFQKGLDLLILEKVEKLIQDEKHNREIRLFDVNYREMKSTKPGYRMFNIIEAHNQKDK